MEKFVLFLGVIPIVKAGVPGTFFWKPRLGLDMSISTSEEPYVVVNGSIVVIDAFRMGTSIMAVSAALTSATAQPSVSPMKAYFYSNAFRWALRYLHSVPQWVDGSLGHYSETHKVWKKRFYFDRLKVPTFLRYLLPHIDWDQEDEDVRLFKFNSEYAFLPHIKYPRKNVKSKETKEESSPEFKP